MPRAVSPRKNVPLSERNAESALVVHESPAQLRLKTLEAQRERLLRDIAKKKAARDLAQDAARDVARDLESRVRPLRETFFSTLKELSEIFAVLLGAESRLNRREKGKLRKWYREVLPDLASEARAEDAGEESEHHVGFGSERGSASTRPSEHESAPSAVKPSDSASTLRALFRKLAVALHPDKVQDQEQREKLTSVMKEVTRAYEIGDLASLVQIEREWLAGSSPSDREDETGRRIAQLLQANKELRRQLRALTAELKELKTFAPTAQTATGRAGSGTKGTAPYVHQVLEEMDRDLAQLQTLRDFARSLLNGTIELSEFLLGPPDISDDEDELFREVLTQLMYAVEPPSPRGGARGSGRRRR